MCWISAKATLEASRHAEMLILQTGMTAFGKAFYRNNNDLVPNVRLNFGNNVSRKLLCMKCLS